MEDASGALELAADGLAMKLVGERHEKRDLVNLVRWLILRKPQGLLPFPVVTGDTLTDHLRANDERNRFFLGDDWLSKLPKS